MRTRYTQRISFTRWKSRFDYTYMAIEYYYERAIITILNIFTRRNGLSEFTKQVKCVCVCIYLLIRLVRVFQAFELKLRLSLHR